MPSEMKLWEVVDEKPVTIERARLDFEERLENWLAEDIGIISEDLLVIGKQVETEYGGVIDLLAIDYNGDLVILELKRHKTPRDIVAQALDYASWVKDLGRTRIENIASSYLKTQTLDSAFKKAFDSDPPETLNDQHRMYIVASEIDASTERIVKYLSESHGVDINVATFVFFKNEGQEFVGKSFLLDEAGVRHRADEGSKRRPNLTLEELEEIAKKHGNLDIYRRSLDEFRKYFDSVTTTRSSVSFLGIMGDRKARNTIVSIIPELDHADVGLLPVYIWRERFCEYFSVSPDEFERAIGAPDPKLDWGGYNVHLFDSENLAKFLNFLNELSQGGQK